MLGKFKLLFISLGIVFIGLACNAAEAGGAQNEKLPANTFSFSVGSLVSVSSIFSGDLSANISSTGALVPASVMKMETALGLESSFTHMFSNAWLMGMSVNWSPVTLNVPASAALNGAANYGGQMNMTQVAGSALLGRRIYASHFLDLRALVNVGLLYYHTTNGWFKAGGFTGSFVPYRGFGVLYGAKLEAILCGWSNVVHPLLSIAYMRSSHITLVNLVGDQNSTQRFPLLDKPKFTESVLMFSVGAAFIM